jgi:23S rRNA pseudouridine955/2504/2580 synthase
MSHGNKRLSRERLPGTGDLPGERPTSTPVSLSFPSCILGWTNHWIALDKPSGLPSRPAPGYPASALSLLEDWLAQQAPGVSRPGVVHRLDRETSGVLLFSLSPGAHRALRAAFASRTIHKDYRAIVLGWPQPRRGLIDLPLRRNASGRMVPDRHGLPARTRYETLERYRSMALLELHPLTGRMHQLRVHLAARGTPVAGDRRYGPRGLPAGIPVPPRLCLHASRIVLPPALLLDLGSIENLLDSRQTVSGTIPAPEPAVLAGYRVRLTAGARGR